MAAPDKSLQSPVHAAKQEITETIKFLDWRRPAIPQEQRFAWLKELLTGTSESLP